MTGTSLPNQSIEITNFQSNLLNNNVVKIEVKTDFMYRIIASYLTDNKIVGLILKRNEGTPATIVINNGKSPSCIQYTRNFTEFDVSWIITD